VTETISASLEWKRTNLMTGPLSKSVTKTETWNALAAHYHKVRDLHLRKLFANDPTRGQRMTAEAADLDLGKQLAQRIIPELETSEHLDLKHEESAIPAEGAGRSKRQLMKACRCQR